jgi:biopolymer transport protein ExbD
MNRPAHLLALAAVAALSLAACDDDKKPASTAPSATASVAPASTMAEPPKPKTMPELLVDADGPYLGGTRVDLAAKNGHEKLTKILGALPIDGKPVTLIAEKKAKTLDVATVVAALGDAGAPKVVIKTDGRNDLPKEITVTPPSRVSSPPPCSIVTMVMKDDLSTAVWSLKGGVAKRQRKGLAGPDLTQTGDEVEKAIGVCTSSMAFVSGDDPIGWEMTYNLAGTMVLADKKKKIDTLVLLREAPVAGRAVEPK